MNSLSRLYLKVTINIGVRCYFKYPLRKPLCESFRKHLYSIAVSSLSNILFDYSPQLYLYIPLPNYQSKMDTQLDISNIFLFGDLTEYIFMEQPLEYNTQGESSNVCLLKCVIYNLK